MDDGGHILHRVRVCALAEVTLRYGLYVRARAAVVLYRLLHVCVGPLAEDGLRRLLRMCVGTLAEGHSGSCRLPKAGHSCYRVRLRLLPRWLFLLPRGQPGPVGRRRRQHCRECVCGLGGYRWPGAGFLLHVILLVHILRAAILVEHHGGVLEHEPPATVLSLNGC